MLVLFTDFGTNSPYVGLMKAAILPYAPVQTTIDLFHDIPVFDVQGASFLLATYAEEFPANTVFVGVVDPGVGGPRDGLIMQADDKLFVGPDNGLFDRVAARATEVQAWHILWRSSRLSATFHGRDIFAPVAAMLAQGTASPAELGEAINYEVREWPDDLARIVYVDRYGNLMTGIRAASLGNEATLRVSEQMLVQRRTFSDVAVGDGFWYENSSGLAEIAVNQGRADVRFGLSAGDIVEVFGQPLTEIRVR